MGIKPFFLLLALLVSTGLSAQLDTSKVYKWNGRQVRYLKVEKGKTLYSISKLYGVSQDTLLVWNPTLEAGLKTGMILRIPLPLSKETSKTVAETNKKKVSGEEKSSAGKSNGDIGKATPPSPEEEVKQCEELDSDNQKRVINIVLFLPFYIQPDGGLNPKAHIGLDFYSGLKMALDSVARSGFNAKVHVFDTRNDSAIITAALKKPECLEADLIVGPLYTSGFRPVANFARKNKICAISPFSQSDAILQSYDNVVKLTPDQESLLSSLVTELAAKKPDAQFVLLRNADEKDKANMNLVASVIRKNNLRHFREIALRNSSSLIDSLHAIKENIVFFPSNNQVQVIDLVSKLGNSTSDKRISLVGMQEWNRYDNIDYDHLNNLKFTYASSYAPDFDSEELKRFRKAYKDEYKAEPGSYSIQGYDLGICFLPLIARYGKGFYRCMENLPGQNGLGMKYRFVRAGKKNGIENQGIHVITLDDFIAQPLKP